jgi:hypothetical protein
MKAAIVAGLLLANTAASLGHLWQNTFRGNPKHCGINLRDTAIYRADETINVSAVDGSVVRVFRVVNNVSQTMASSPRLSVKLPIGYYFAESAKDRAGFVVLPKDWKPASWFGLETLSMVDWNWPISRVYKQLRPNWVRCGEACWFRVQTGADDNPAHWNWRWVDDAIAHAGKANIIISGSYAPPQYATNPATFFRGWTNYFTAVCQRYKTVANAGRLYFEIWNEPWPVNQNQGFCQFPYQLNPPQTYADATNWPQVWTNWANCYVQMVATTRQAKTKLKSGVKLIGPSAGQFEDMTALINYLAVKKQLGNLDAVSVHDYTWNVPIDFADTRPNVRPGRTGLSFRKAWLGLIGSKPIFIDEAGTFGRSAITDAGYKDPGEPEDPKVVRLFDWRTGMNRFVKTTLVDLCTQTTCIIPHCLHFLPGGSDLQRGMEWYGWEEAGYGIKPNAASYLMLAHLTRGYKSRGLKQAGTHFTALFGNGVSCRVFMWSKEGTVSSLAGLHLVDLFGNPLPAGQVSDEVGYYDIRSGSPISLDDLP